MSPDMSRFLTIILTLISLFDSFAYTNIQSSPPLHQTYLDIKPLNLTRCLETIRSVNITTYRLPFDRKEFGRLRLGVIGPQVASLIPDAVDIIPKRVVPPEERDGNPLIMFDVPVINENTIFMYGVGATQELIKKVEKVTALLNDHIKEISQMHGEASKLEYLLTKAPEGDAEVRIRAALAEAEAANLDVEFAIKNAEEEERFLHAQNNLQLESIKKNEELAHARINRENEISEMRYEEELRNKIEMSRLSEESKRDAARAISKMQYERDLELQRANEEAKTRVAQAVTKAKAEAERANEDVHIRRLQEEAEQRRLKSIAVINTIAMQISASFSSASENPRQVLIFVIYIGLFLSTIFASREIAKMIRVIIESTIGKPKLIRETTRKSIPVQYLKLAKDLLLSALQIKLKNVSILDTFHDVALDDELMNKIVSLAVSASKVRKNNAPHRHVLFFGPPGTGKTMVAKKLAKIIGMDYALMSGGDVGPLGSDAVTQIHNLFHWAKMSRKGVLLFIDEAECFLSDRSKNYLSENAHNALNALLYNTGTQRTDFMMVLATNRAEDLDAAVLDRCDESLFFPLPDENCRKKLIADYFNAYVRMLQRNSFDKNKSLLKKMFQSLKFENERFTVTIDDDVMNEQQLNAIASCTAGFSCREIAKLIIGIQSCLYSSEIPHLSAKMVENVVDSKVIDHQNKMRISRLPHAKTTGTDDVDLSFSSEENSDRLDESLNKSIIRRAMNINLEELNILATP